MSTPISPPSGPDQWLFQGPPAESKFLAAYADLVTKNATKQFKSYAMPSSRLDYHAIAQFHKEFKLNDKTFANVNVVTLVLIFSANFTAEATSGMQFEKIRIVILDAANKVLHISGDGPTEVPIMML
ncbi:MAG: hypothetical protein QE267_04645 [Akkermansiaceae bacterium]|nr:hypothetical protein [Akkermansiaceae bacterium]